MEHSFNSESEGYDANDTCIHRLMIAILLRTVNDLHLAHSQGDKVTIYTKHICKEGLKWIKSGNRSYLFSFNVICECLKLDTVKVRKTLITKYGKLL